MMTIQVLIKNHIKTIENCLNSLSGLGEIFIGDLGSTDGTLEICKNYGKIFKIDFKNDYSQIKNNLAKISKAEWQFSIEPWEKIVSGQEQLLWAITQEHTAYNVYNLQNETLTKQLRLWNKNHHSFIRPVCENIEPPTEHTLDCIITGSINRFEETMYLLNQWQKTNPLLDEIEYYKSLTYLSNKKYDDFLVSAKNYLFKNNEPSTSSLLINNYIALVYFLIKEDMSTAINHCIDCLITNPTIAEFWCLLGDIFFKLKHWNRAIVFYENAILFGSQRKNTSYPIDVSKYKEYPEKMIEKCKTLVIIH